MKISVIWICNHKKKAINERTLNSLKETFTGGSDSCELFVYAADKKSTELIKGSLSGLSEKVALSFSEGSFSTELPHLIYADATERITGDYVTMLYSGDTWTSNALAVFKKMLGKYPGRAMYMLSRRLVGDDKKEYKDGLFGKPSKLWWSKQKCGIIDLKEEFNSYPFYLGGTFVDKTCFTKDAFLTEKGPDGERRFFLDLCLEKMELVYMLTAAYISDEPYEGDKVYFKRIYHEEYYLSAIEDFWIPYLTGVKEKLGSIPDFLQYHVLAVLYFRFSCNMDNKNKHVIEGREEDFFKLAGKLLSLLDDRVILDEAKVKGCKMGGQLMWIFQILKHGEDYKFKLFEEEGRMAYGEDGVVVGYLNNFGCKFTFMESDDGKLIIDGAVGPVLYSLVDEVYVEYGDKKYPVEYTGRYMLTKAFGVSIYKGHPYRVVIDDLGSGAKTLKVFARFGEHTVLLNHDFQGSHFSRIGPYFKSNYWTFYSGGSRYLVTKRHRRIISQWSRKNYKDSLKIRKTNPVRVFFQEFLLLLEMLFTFTRGLRPHLFILIRLAYFISRPFLKKRPIWMYLDKIYKAGDSSEYLYRYSVAQNDGIDHYYLVDKSTPDYNRLCADGFKPLVRGTIKHRLIFLMADMMVISNSTVFAFNNFGMINSSYIRDLVDFHVCCVQHGMSVQKIAVAQNRLRDNTRLYFCASRYEFDNLERPVYDYVGHDALKMTGVPRYDGLKNDDKKQIMISPTWRMQSAVPVKGSESYQRTYNAMFKETPYFKVYNGLISDKRLIEAAKQYGYRIKYVLHPIVSVQEKDFTKNDYVDIVPAVGDMSYEKMFCESSLMVTDFSGVQFDFAYMKKPLLYLHHKDIPQHYEEGSFFYDTMAFGEICHTNDELIDQLIDYMKNGCRMKEMYQERVDDFFNFHDHENCKRIYKVMREYMDKKITPHARWRKRWKVGEA